MFPRLIELPQGDSPDLKTGFPDTNAIQRPSGDHASEWAGGLSTTGFGGPPPVGRTWMTQFST
jgi:hypothetical protein